uniref:Uncharacterized protein n=1 Tax=Picea glauca TaxID=3330 RepID=A0A124GN38_PICGL|nr:hypothetical protein ABT39_MTgene5804 [Picea glauca]QHR86887.1 hypothetical protein Q903MT_gene894 [Picea sitchensis]
MRLLDEGGSMMMILDDGGSQLPGLDAKYDPPSMEVGRSRYRYREPIPGITSSPISAK